MAYDLPEGYTREMLNQVEQQERDLLPGITPLMDEPRESWRASNVSEDTFEDWFAMFVATLQIAWPERQRSDPRLARVPSFPLDSVPLVKTVWIAIAEFVCQFDMPLPSSAVPPQAYDTVCCLQCLSGLPSQHASHRCKPAPFTLCIVYRVLRFGRAWSDSGYSDKPMWTVTESEEPYGCVPMKTFRMALGLHQIELKTAFSATLLLQQNQAAKRERNLNLESEKLKHTNEQLRLAGVRDKRDYDESIQALRDELKQLKDGFQRERKTRDEAARTLASQHSQRIESAGLALRRLKMNVGGLENNLAAERAQTQTLTEQLGRLQETDLARSLEVGELRRDKDALQQTVTEAAHSSQLLSTTHAELNGRFNALQHDHRLALQANAAARSLNQELVAKSNRQLGQEKALTTALATLQSRRITVQRLCEEKRREIENLQDGVEELQHTVVQLREQQEEDQDQVARLTAHNTELVRSRALQDAQRQRLVDDHTAATAANQYHLDTLHDALLESTESFDTFRGDHVELQCNYNELQMDRTEIQQELRAVKTALQKSRLKLERLEDQGEKLQRELGAVQTQVQRQNGHIEASSRLHSSAIITLRQEHATIVNDLKGEHEAATNKANALQESLNERSEKVKVLSDALSLQRAQTEKWKQSHDQAAKRLGDQAKQFDDLRRSTAQLSATGPVNVEGSAVWSKHVTPLLLKSNRVVEKLGEQRLPSGPFLYDCLQKLLELANMGTCAIVSLAFQSTLPGQEALLKVLMDLTQDSSVLPSLRAAVTPESTELANLCRKLGQYLDALPDACTFASESQLQDTVIKALRMPAAKSSDAIHPTVICLEALAELFKRNASIKPGLVKLLEERYGRLKQMRQLLLSGQPPEDRLFCVWMVRRIDMVEQKLNLVHKRIENWIKGELSMFNAAAEPLADCCPCCRGPNRTRSNGIAKREQSRIKYRESVLMVAS